MEGKNEKEEFMVADLTQINLLARREIEARIAGPLINALMEEFGKEKVLEVVRKAIGGLAREAGLQLAQKMGETSIRSFAKGLEAWGSGGAYNLVELELTDERYSFDITRCRYAEMYRQLGLQELGVTLSCSRDFDLVKGFNPKMKLTRTKTIMEGGDCCDFRITLE
jgi:hypothetical protein